MNEAILQKLAKTKGIYATLNKQYEVIKSELEEKKIDTDNILFIDGVSKKRNTPENAGKVTYISGPESLTDLSIAITVATNTGNYKFLLLDSLTTLLIYNDAHNTQKFAHYLISKMSSYGMSMIILTLDEENSKKMLPILTPFCTKVITV